jgi:hypothetical protein
MQRVKATSISIIGARIKKDSVPKGLYWDTGNQFKE